MKSHCSLNKFVEKQCFVFPHLGLSVKLILSYHNTRTASAKHMDYYNNHQKSSIRNLFIASLLLSLLLYLSISSKTISHVLIISKASSSSLASQEDSVIDELERALSRASMSNNNNNNNKTVVIAIANRAYVEGNITMLDLFLGGFRAGENTEWLLNHLLVVSVDEIAFLKCKSVGALHCYRIGTEGVDLRGEKLYMSRDFVDMMWRRTGFLREVVRRGYSFVFTERPLGPLRNLDFAWLSWRSMVDAINMTHQHVPRHDPRVELSIEISGTSDMDVMWLRDPFKWLSRDENIDVQISCDHFFGNQWSKSNLINTGFYYVRSNNRTLSMFDTWHSMRNDSSCKGMKEQDVLERMIRTRILDRLGVKMRFLDTVSFSGFCEDSRRFGMVTTVHANCCRTISAKVADLTAVLGDWMRLKALIRDWRKNRGSRNGTHGLRWSKHVACSDSWISYNFTSNRVIS
ncbi:hypothetical protein Sjap_004652 [Stephania japonica]|uniref:Nucleotide-diphospho-sugar transferase domain-containing protein n=1 Tax=Stephania japonica TaxID=461633 RepID=A0AAP0K3Y1_9MAGN